MDMWDIAGNLEGYNPSRFHYPYQLGNMLQYQLGRALVLENAAGVYEIKPARWKNAEIIVRVVYELTSWSKGSRLGDHLFADVDTNYFAAANSQCSG